MVINACKKAFKVAKPLIINLDQDSQFTSDKTSTLFVITESVKAWMAKVDGQIIS